MVRPAVYRKAKYEGKIDPEVIRSRITALKATMAEQMESRAAELATIETNIKAIIDAAPTAVFAHMVPAYLNVGRELYRLSKKFAGKTFEVEAKLVCDKWLARGLNKDILVKIAELFGVAWTPPA